MSLLTIFSPPPSQPNNAAPPPPQNNENNSPTQSPPPAAHGQSGSGTGTASNQSGAGAGNGTGTGGATTSAAQASRSARPAEAESNSVITAQADPAADRDLERARQSAIAAMEAARKAYLIEELKVKSPQEPRIDNLVRVDVTERPPEPAAVQALSRTA